jgi:hypothetical protein
VLNLQDATLDQYIDHWRQKARHLPLAGARKPGKEVPLFIMYREETSLALAGRAEAGASTFAHNCQVRVLEWDRRADGEGVRCRKAFYAS